VAVVVAAEVLMAVLHHLALKEDYMEVAQEAVVIALSVAGVAL
jgi:hypothetical protein